MTTPEQHLMKHTRSAWNIFYGRWRFGPFAQMLTAFLCANATGIIMIAMAWRIKDLGGGTGALGAIGGMYMGVYLLSLVGIGSKLDKWGAKQVIVPGMCIAACVYFLTPILDNVGLLLAVTGLLGLLNGLLWPPLMAWVTAGLTGRNLNRRAGMYNLSWTIGSITGALLGGPLYYWGHWVPFVFCGCLAIIVVISLAATRNRRTSASTPRKAKTRAPEPEPRLESFLLTSRLALFTAWIMYGALRTPITALLIEMGLGPIYNSVLAGAISSSMAVGFFIFGASGRWHFNRWILAAGQLSAAIMVLTIPWAAGPVMLLAVTALSMPGTTLTYASHMFYSASGDRNKAGAMAIHEFTLGAGGAIGSFGGGILASFIGIRWVYPVMGMIVIVSVLVQLVIQPRLTQTSNRL